MAYFSVQTILEEKQNVEFNPIVVARIKKISKKLIINKQLSIFSLLSYNFSVGKIV